MPADETHVTGPETAMLVHPNLEPEHNAKVVDCYVCHSENDCLKCHDPVRANCSKVDSTYMHVGCEYDIHCYCRKYTVVSRYYDAAGIRKKYHNIQTIEISSIDF